MNKVKPSKNIFDNSPQNTELTKIKSTGNIPKWLSGKLVRNGPALFHLDSVELKHWFDGYGMLHGFLFKDGEAYYQSRYTESKEYLNARSSGKVSTVAWGTASDPCRSVFRRFMANYSAIPDNTNVNVIKIGDKYFSTSDIATISEFDIESLETLSNFTASKGGTMAAHPSYTDDNQLWNMISKFGPISKNSIIAIDDKPSTKNFKSFSTKDTYYFHSFGNTNRYFISVEQPMKLNFLELVKSGISNKSFYECFSWHSDATNIFHIYDRKEDSIISINSSLKFFYFHTINSYEDGDYIHIDLCGYDTNAIIDDFYIDNLATDGIKDENKARLRRISINLRTKAVTEEDLHINLELPNINDTYRNKPYRYAYGVHSPQGSNKLAAQIVKYDFSNSTFMLWGQDNITVGEPIFVGNPKGIDEDDGILLVLCHNLKTSLAELVVLDAKNLDKTASFGLPQSIPPALHGWFYNLNN